jgi:23S rRNA pseudoU1915 N3-methylase RlmH
LAKSKETHQIEIEIEEGKFVAWLERRGKSLPSRRAAAAAAYATGASGFAQTATRKLEWRWRRCRRSWNLWS